MYEIIKKDIQRQMIENNIPDVLTLISVKFNFENEKPSLDDIYRIFSDFSWYQCFLTKGPDTVHLDTFSKHLLADHYPYTTGIKIIIYTHNNHEYLRK